MNCTKPERDRDILACYKETQSTCDVANRFGLTRQRVSQILQKMNLPASSFQADRRRKRAADAAQRLQLLEQIRREKDPLRVLERLCVKIGYVPSTTEMQHDHRALNQRIMYNYGSIADALETTAQKTGLLRRFYQCRPTHVPITPWECAHGHIHHPRKHRTDREKR